jgi:hypothetical protein
LVLAITNVQAERIGEIKQYFELRDTLSLVNLEMKRALAPDSKSKMLSAPESEQEVARLVMFLEQRVKDFSQLNSAFKYHYTRNLEKLLLETRFLYANLLTRIRAGTNQHTLKPETEKPKETKSKLEVKPRPYFHPIDVRTLLSPSLLENYNRSIEKNSDDITTKSDYAKVVSRQKKKQPVSSGELLSGVNPKKSTVGQKSKKIIKTDSSDLSQTQNSVVPARPSSQSENIPQKPLNIKNEIKVVPPPPVQQEEKKIEQIKKNTLSKNVVASEPKPVSVASETQKIKTTKANEKKVAKRPVAVMIENHRRARPQSGLIDAEVVYDIPVEGGITRFMALFYHTPGVLGPVRSCREYFVDRALEIDALYVHCGGSPKGYAYLAKSKIGSIDEIKFGKPFYRDKSRKAPHNLYTKGKRLLNFMADRYPMKVEKLKMPLNYGDNPTIGKKPGKSVKIRYHGNNITEYKFNKVSYDRYINGKKHLDREKKKVISPGTVIVQTASMKVVDKAGRQEISFIGSGSAVVLYQGKMFEATWHKSEPGARTVFKKLNGKEVVFSDKQKTWIQVVSPKLKVVYNNGKDKDSQKAGKD